MVFDPVPMRVAVMAAAVFSFVLFLLFVYIPHLRNTATVQKDFFNNPLAVLETCVFALLYTVLFSVLFLSPSSTLSPALSLTGGTLAISGLVLALVGRLSLKENWQPVTDAQSPNALRVQGVFRYVRHPIYCGRLVFFIGTMLLFASPLIVLAIPYWYLLRRKAREEERLLDASIPGYVAYRRSTFSPF